MIQPAQSSSSLNSADPRVIVIHPGGCVSDFEHGFQRNWGICGATAASHHLSMAIGTLAPGVHATAHSHAMETAIYILKGRVRVKFGKRLVHQIDVAAGDFLFIPPGVEHGPENLGDEPMVYLVARNSPDED